MIQKVCGIGVVTAGSLHTMPGLTLEVRRGVEMREYRSGSDLLLYLSLLDDEIDQRLALHVETVKASGYASGSGERWALEAAGCWLEPSDALVCYRGAAGTAVIRGGCCVFPLYWRSRGQGVGLATALPVNSGERLSRAGLAGSLAAICLQGSYEPNASDATPLQGWRRVRRGTITEFSAAGTPLRERLVMPGGSSTLPAASEAALADQVRRAISGYGTSQKMVSSAVVELSGGYDSTLAVAPIHTQDTTVHGVSVAFPWYEFRFEEAVQAAVSEALAIPRIVLDGSALLPYAPARDLPRFDEPSVFITGIGHAEAVADFAAQRGAARVYTGHGGDQLFSTDLTSQEAVGPPPARAAFSRPGWRAFREALAQTRMPVWLRRDTACYVYHGRQDVWLKESRGITARTPFADLAVFRAALAWSRHSASQGARPDKSILARACGEWLPAAVLGRKGKVAYDGVWLRAYAVHQEHISRTIEGRAGVLEHIGLSPAWLQRRVRQLADWQPVGDREVIGAYALASWLKAWEVNRVIDVAWE